MIRAATLLAILILTGCTLAQQGAFNLESYGTRAASVGVPNDGQNDTAALMDAIAALPASGGEIHLDPGVYHFAIDISGNGKNVTLLARGCIFRPAVSWAPIISCDNTGNGAAGTRLEIIGAEIDGNNEVDACISLANTSGITLRNCFVRRAKAYGLVGNFAQYCKFVECVFSEFVYMPISCGVFLTGPDGDHRSNECWFSRCQFFSNRNHLRIEAAECTRIESCTFQDQQWAEGVQAGLWIGANAAGNGSRKTSVRSCYFELNDYLDIYIGVSESVAVSDSLFFNSNQDARTSHKIGSIYTDCAYDLIISGCQFVTADTPSVGASHSGPVATFIGNNKCPSVVRVTGANPTITYIGRQP